MNSVLCPHCGKQIEISEALKHQIEEEVLIAERKKHKLELAKLQKEAEEKITKQITEELELKVQDTENKAQEVQKRNRQLQEQLLELNKLIRELRMHNEQRELELQKRFTEEAEKLRENIAKTEQEKASLEILQLKKKLEDTEKSLQEAQRKAQQSSQQLQGEIMELDLEQQLKTTFPTDEITPVPKGIEGADVMQIVKNKFGHVAGTILWETKRTKAWSSLWPSKLRDDCRKTSASVAILVSEVLPSDIETFGLHEGIWISSYQYALPLGNVLRIGLLQVAIAKATAANKDEKLEELYRFLTTDGFRHRFEAQVESIIALKDDLETEQRTTMRLWKKREMHINRMRNNVSLLYGELQGIVGGALPTIHSLDAPPSSTQRNLLEE